jgi:hypothetical protein
MGDSAFFQMLNTYAADTKYAYKNANSADFQAVCEEIYGSSLDWFFEQWLMWEGEPEYRYHYTTTPSSGGHNVDLWIEQTQPNNIYQMPLEVRFVMASRDSSVTVWNDWKSRHYTFSMPLPVFDVELDPDGWVLADKNEGGVSPMPPMVVSPNPFNSETLIVFETTASGPVNLVVYDVTGARVKTLQSGTLSAAFYKFPWDGSNDAGDSVAAGVYFVDLQTPTVHTTSRAVLVR